MNATAAGGVEDALVTAAIVLLKVIGWLVVVVALSVFGWAVSSLHVLAGWTDGGLAARLEIIRGVLASIGAGGVAAAGGFYYDLPIVVICLVVFLSGTAGQRFLQPMADRLLGRLMGAFDAFFGKNGNGTPK